MGIIIHAACGCNTGKIRKNNEDNFYFDGRCLERVNDGLNDVISSSQLLTNNTCMAVFDGMGGERFGEYASYLAAEKLKQLQPTLKERFLKQKDYLVKVAQVLDETVVKAQEELRTQHMGATMAGLWFFNRKAYICNLGDSRVYRLRGGGLKQLSVDHVEKRPLKPGRKAPLTQHLGAGSEEIRVEPSIAISGINFGDKYLLCTDGLTDMLADTEILKIMEHNATPHSIVRSLIRNAMEQGGRDNITVIVCSLDRSF